MDTVTPCEAVAWRKTLTLAIQRACSPTGKPLVPPADGSEKALLLSFDVLCGIVEEYLEGGDQLVENCTCGSHTK